MSLFQEIYEVLIARTYKDSLKVKLATEAMAKAKEIALMKTFLPSVEGTGGVLAPQFSNLETISLGTAHDNLEIWNRPAKGLFILNFTGISANTRIRFDEIASTLYPVRSGYIKTSFEKIYLTNTAQTGKNLQFIVAHTDTAEFLLTDPATNDELIKQVATTPVCYNVAITTADTEYYQTLPAGTRRFRIVLADGTAFRLAYATGRVAYPTAPYWTQPANIPFEEWGLFTTDKTVFFACATGTKVAQIIAWV